MNRSITLVSDLAWFVLALLALPGAAPAAEITYQFSGGSPAVTLIGGVALPSEITGWTSFSGTLVIDDSVADLSASTTVGYYGGAALSIDVAFSNGYSAAGSDGIVYQSRNDALQNSGWHAESFTTLTTDFITVNELVAINFALSDGDIPNQDLSLDPNSLFLDLPSPSEVSLVRWVELIFRSPEGGAGYVRAPLLEITAVPEPGSLALLGLGLVALGCARKSVRRRSD